MADTVFVWFFVAVAAFIAYGFLSIFIQTLRRESAFDAPRPPAPKRAVPAEPAAGGMGSTSTSSDTYGVQPVESLSSSQPAFETADSSSDVGSDSSGGDYGSGGDFGGGGGDYGGGGGSGSWS